MLDIHKCLYIVFKRLRIVVDRLIRNLSTKFDNIVEGAKIITMAAIILFLESIENDNIVAQMLDKNNSAIFIRNKKLCVEYW